MHSAGVGVFVNVVRRCGLYTIFEGIRQQRVKMYTMLSGQDLLDYIAKYLNVRFEVISNIRRPRQSKITFCNNGDQNISNDGWAIYTYHLCEVETEHIQMDVEHVVGGLFKFTPTTEFQDLLPGEKLEIVLNADEPTASRSMLFPNWYVTRPGLQAKVIVSTADESLSFIGEFNDSHKWKKYESDQSNPYTMERRYEKCVVADLGESTIPIVPTPLEATLQYDKRVNLSKHCWVIINSHHIFANEARLLSEYLGIDVVSNITETNGKNPIMFCKEHVNNQHSSADSYKIVIQSEPEMITLSAETSAGMFYAIQSVKSMIEDQPQDSAKSIPRGVVIDAPRFQYRGLHIDVARNFVGVDEIMKLIHVMSAYKMNKLHFHLTDDEGWRIEIEDLPELTEIGAKRDHDLARDGLAIEPTLGSGPCFNSASKRYYTTEDYQNILRCAASHHVQVIPEIDMPGHSYAAIVAMTARYHSFKSKGDVNAAEEYLLIDLDDQSMYSSDQKYTNNTMNPFLKGTKNFVAKIIQSLIDLHKPIQPLKIFHVGGDEVPIGAWDGSTICMNYIKTNDLMEDQYCDSQDGNEEEILSRRKTATIQEHFTQYVESFCADKNLQLAVWNDGIWDPTTKQTTDVTPRLVHAWRISKKNDRHNPNVLANSGYHVVISSATHTYFDHPYEPDPEEGGLTWCVRMVDTKTAFSMKPYDMYACQDKGFSAIDHEKLTNKSAIYGIQCHIWSELIRNEEKLEYMLFPRLLAIAERGWHEGVWEDNGKSDEMEKDWCDFANTIGYKELRRLDEMGISFRIPPPGLKKKGDTILLGCSYPNLRFKYKTSGEDSWKDTSGSIPAQEISENEKCEFVTYYGSRMSRVVSTM